MWWIKYLILFICLYGEVNSLDNGLLRQPPMVRINLIIK
jgi:hypothetical protein